MDTTYERIAHAIEWLEAHRAEHPSLADVAEACGTSPFHFQRTFRQWAGVTPKQLLSVLSLERAKETLRSGGSVLDATFDASLSGPSRLHDLFVSIEAVTPGEFARQGRGLVVRHGRVDTPFGSATIATTERGLCHLSFDDADPDAELRERFAEATLTRDADAAARIAEHIFVARRGRIAVHVEGTNFQVQVWRALLSIPEGAATTYGRIAAAIGRPSSSRAVGSAVGQNPIAFLVPCHRVLRATGALSGYRWGERRKRAILAWEAARLDDDAPVRFGTGA